MGISRRWHPNWLGWGRIDQFKKSMNGKIPNSHIFNDPNLQKMVNDFYYQTYWMDIKAGQLRDQKLAEYMLDTTIMHGFTGKKMIQQAVNRQNANLKVDGRFGQETIKAIQDAEPCTIRTDMSRLRLGQMDRIIAKDQSQSAFAAGWKKRVEVSP